MPFASLDYDSGAFLTEQDLPGRQLILIADVAHRLLAAEDADTLVEEVFAAIHEELRLDAFLDYRAYDNRLALAAYGGLTTEEAAAAATLGFGEAVSGCVARDRTPIHATAIQASADPQLAFVKAIGLDVYACTPLVHGAELIGTLGFGRRWTDRFRADELLFLQTICHYVALAKHRLAVEGALREALAERERLLAELNHRVRNALQLAIGMIVIERDEAGEPAARAALALAAERIEVLAAAHRPLYVTARPEAVDLQTLLQGVIEQAREGAPLVEADGAYALPIERAVALALLVHTLLGRADFPAPRLRLWQDSGNQSLRLTFTGSMSGIDPERVAEDRMVRALLRQLRGSVVAADGGLELSLPATP